ncbi:MAG TPA: hypothetical protein VFC85_03900, partial [Verrucomicrobiae bacterium]|nr:hypothetical protein [Verrucomicrobiae bacterium]
MNETPKNKSSRRISRALLIWLILFILIVFAQIAGLIVYIVKYPHDEHLFSLSVLAASFLILGVVGASIPLCLLMLVRWLRSWRNLRRALIGLAILATLIAIFYTEEDWRGKRAWENCKRELEAKGAVLDWDKYIPPPVPDDQNFFTAPKMQDWFVSINGAQHKNELHTLATNAILVAVITNKTAAADFISWSDQFEPDFDLIREALKRPYARMDGDYSIPYKIPIPNFVSTRALAQVLDQRTKCYLMLNQPEKAL